MKDIQVEWLWLDEGETVTESELLRASGLTGLDLEELMGYGALVPIDAQQAERAFSAACLAPLRTASKLRVDYDLDLFTVALLLDYAGRIEALERQLRTLQARTP